MLVVVLIAPFAFKGLTIFNLLIGAILRVENYPVANENWVVAKWSQNRYKKRLIADLMSLL